MRDYFKIRQLILGIILIPLSCQTAHYMVQNWFSSELIPKSFVLEFESNIIYKKIGSTFENFPVKELKSIKILPLKIDLDVARFESVELAIGAFLEIKTVNSQPIKIRHNYWGYLSEDKKKASIWQDKIVYLIKSSVPKNKKFYIGLFNKITKERPATLRRPLYFRIFLHPKTNLLALRYFLKSPNEKDKLQKKSILTNYFYAPWELNGGKAILAIRPFQSSTLAKQYFYWQTKASSKHIFTKWNTHRSINKKFMLSTKQTVNAYIEKDTSYPVIIYDNNFKKNYYILYENTVILLTGKVSEKESKEILNKILLYLD